MSDECCPTAGTDSPRTLVGWILWCLAYFIGAIAIFFAAFLGTVALLAAVAPDDVEYDLFNVEFTFRSDGPASVLVYNVFA